MLTTVPLYVVRKLPLARVYTSDPLDHFLGAQLGFDHGYAYLTIDADVQWWASSDP